jgi:LPPG:FO 2-phospho-L-lactate transferase
MTDSRVATFVDTDQGELAFQEYFVHRGWQPVVKSMRFAGVETAQPTLEVLQAMARADAIVFCPSNPFVSIDPILAVQGMRGAISQARVPRVAVSPIVSGEALRGPAAKMFRELGLEPSALAVAMRYEGLIDAFVVDKADEAQAQSIQALGIRTLATDTVMKTDADRGRLAKEIVNWVTGSLDR